MEPAEIITQCENWVKDHRENVEHMLRTGYWLQQLLPDAPPELIVAGITHDIERAFPAGRQPRGNTETGSGGDWNDPVYNLWHGQRSAEITGEFLAGLGADKRFISRVKRLITRHETGGTKCQNLLRDADSLSFLEVNSDIFISFIPQKRTADQVREKFDDMYQRITTPAAKDIAANLYNQAIKKLNSLG